MSSIREDANIIIAESIKTVLPEEAVIRALKGKEFSGTTAVVSIGKAAWNMASAAKNTLGNKVSGGVVVTKYKHSLGTIEGFEIVEAGHPIPDENSVLGGKKALELVGKLTEKDTLIFLISGGGSALFEKPIEGVSLEDLIDVTDKLLKCGADIVEINTIRKHLSTVKGGRFASQCKAHIYAVVLSDVLGDSLDSIASGPVYRDSSTSQDAFDILEKYKLSVSNSIKIALKSETPKRVDNCETVIIGSVGVLCEAAAASAQKLGYTAVILSANIDCEAKEAGKFMASIAKEIKQSTSTSIIAKPPCAIIAGGETVVRIVGKGLGGRNQELALSAAIKIAGLDDVVVFSLGSDGTDGPTDAAGGIVDGTTCDRINASGSSPQSYIDNNDSYNALKISGDLIMTGPTGTNVNDIMVLLCK